jgi:hypothetical protein
VHNTGPLQLWLAAAAVNAIDAWFSFAVSDVREQPVLLWVSPADKQLHGLLHYLWQTVLELV